MGKVAVRTLVLTLLVALTLIPVSTTSAAAAPAYATQVVSSSSHTCALDDTGTPYCWGKNSHGQLGDGTTVSKNVPTAVSTGLKFTSLALGYYSSCGLTAAGAAWCWGYDGYGQLGDNAGTDQLTPVAVQGSHVFTSIYSGLYNVCGLVGGAAWCWGDNAYGQIGDNTTTVRRVPFLVLGGMSFSSMAVGFRHACGLTSAGAAYCWGDDTNGALGDGTTTSTLQVGAAIPSFTFTSISAGGYNTCGLISGGVAYCWGDNSFNQIGDNTSTRRTSPQAVSGGLSFVSINTNQAVGAHTCAMTAAGASYCWGYNANGEIGSGTTTNSKVPVATNGGNTFTQVTAGGDNSCGLVRAGLVYCWGKDQDGQNGDGLNTDDLSPVLAQIAVTGTSNSSTVTLGVNASFLFTVAGSASTCNGQSASNFQTGSTGSAVSLGHLSTPTLGGGAQTLSVSNNAGGGFTVYIRTSGVTPNSMRDASGDTIADVSGVNATPGGPPVSGTAGFGYTSSDTSTAFTSNTWAKLTNGNDVVMTAAGGVTTKASCVGYEVAVSPSTPAANYSSNIVYTAVPVF